MAQSSSGTHLHLDTGLPSAQRSGVQARSLRAMNLSLVLKETLANSDTVTRAAIAQRTGITPATVSCLVDELTASGLVNELPPIDEGTRGRPANRLSARGSAAIALGLEVNVSGLGARMVDLGGTVLAEVTKQGDYADSDPAKTITELARLAHHLYTQHCTDKTLFIGTGLALPGLVSHNALTIAPNLGWRDIPFDQLLEPMGTLRPTVIANEADLAAYAVSSPRPGVPSGPASFVFVSGEVGVGAGIIIDHKSMSGAHGWSGEIGHICTDPAGPACSCGANGCLEAFLGLRALATHAGLERDATIATIIEAATGGSSQAQHALEQGGIALGRALAATINLVDLPLVILGGNLAELEAYIATPALAEMKGRTLQAPWQTPTIEVLPDSAWLAVTGAAHRVFDALVNNPLDWIE